ncbi:cytochrome C biogenesis protein CcdA [Thermanaerosceptrum fracticalcis]|uniref:Cytochrome C biogenesis protein CcdA n=1 Tax=Thermanaerosceptrum fracticalcis TaxID=1712410 RepID=A0A7G6E3W1_THEFR|nr:cytochrome c biogenesis protein CcdA [Thermanaerosceptrum fracticalcis]QNB46765.1 cytochrome C biogenesis protein CcdA [Thermanaerosceptrum fracticalcis]
MSLYLLSFLAGIVSFVSPCIIPMLSGYFTFITGLSLKELRNLPDNKELKKEIFLKTLMFVLAFTIIFTLAGGAAGAFSKLLKEYKQVLNFIGGAAVILLALNILGLIGKKGPDHCKIPGAEGKGKASYLKAFGIGIVFAVACSHCIGPVLYSILIMAGSLGSISSGMTVMFFFSTGLAIPYLLASLYMDKIIKAIHRTWQVEKTVNLVLGLIMLGMGVLIMLDKFTLLTAFTAKLLPFKLPIGM